MGTAVIVAASFAATAYISGDLAGVNVAVITLLPLAIFDNLTVIPGAFSKIRQHLESVISIEKLLHTEPLSKAAVGVPTTFNRITFNNARPILPEVIINPISAQVDINNPLLIMGASGSGKSSLINSLLGFLPYQGSIDIDGVAVRNIEQERKTSMITVLLQNDYLFNSSIS